MGLAKLDFRAIGAMFAGVLACTAPSFASNSTGINDFGSGNAQDNFKKAPVAKALNATFGAETRIWLSETSKQLRELASNIENDLIPDLIKLRADVSAVLAAEFSDEASENQFTYDTGILVLADFEEHVLLVEKVHEVIYLFLKTSDETFPFEVNRKDRSAVNTVFGYYEEICAFRIDFKLILGRSKPVDYEDFDSFDLSEDWDADIDFIANATVEHFSLNSVA